MLCNYLKRLDSGFRRNDGKRYFSTFYETIKSVFVNIFTGKAKFQPALRFGCFLHRICHLVLENGRITPFPPPFRQVGAYRSRRSSYLIHQRKLLFRREALCHLKNRHRRIKRTPVNIQIPKMPNIPFPFHASSSSHPLIF